MIQQVTQGSHLDRISFACRNTRHHQQLTCRSVTAAIADNTVIWHCWLDDTKLLSWLCSTELSAQTDYIVPRRAGDVIKQWNNTISQEIINTLRSEVCGDNTLSTIRVPQTSLSSQSLGKYWQVNQNIQKTEHIRHKITIHKSDSIKQHTQKLYKQKDKSLV